MKRLSLDSGKSWQATKKSASLHDRTLYHTVTLHPVAPDEMDQDSEKSDVSIGLVQ